MLLTLPIACTLRVAPAATPEAKASASAPAGEPSATPTRTKGTAIGQEAPDLSLVDLNGQPVDLSDYRGRLVLLNFWATWCGPCRMEVPGLVAVQKAYGDRGFTVVAVNLGEPQEQVQAFAQDNGMDFPILLDPEGRSQSLYPTRGIPTSFILDQEGVIRQVVVGAMDEEMLAWLVEAYL